VRAQQRLSQCEHQQQQDGRISIHPSTYYIYISIYLARCITHSVRYSLARSLISFFPIIIKRAAAAKGRSSESLSATPEVRPSVPQSRPPRRISYLFYKAPSFTDPLRAARRTFRSHGRCWKFSTIASLVLMQSVRRTCSQRFGPLASADGLVFSQQQAQRARRLSGKHPV
jgi:hypothetical protein